MVPARQVNADCRFSDRTIGYPNANPNPIVLCAFIMFINGICYYVML